MQDELIIGIVDNLARDANPLPCSPAMGDGMATLSCSYFKKLWMTKGGFANPKIDTGNNSRAWAKMWVEKSAMPEDIIFNPP